MEFGNIQSKLDHCSSCGDRKLVTVLQVRPDALYLICYRCISKLSTLLWGEEVQASADERKGMWNRAY
jgi:hypothetical protein